MSRVEGFPPVVGQSPRVLILGSMPGRASLDAVEYYAMPRNAFWPIMGELFGAGFDVSYQNRLEILMNRGVALWDVLSSCVRPGSLDSAIDMSTVETNNFVGLFAANPSIQAVFFNGRKAADLYRKRVLPGLTSEDPALATRHSPEYLTLPSTSPAHAALRFADKLKAWQAVSDIAVSRQGRI